MNKRPVCVVCMAVVWLCLSLGGCTWLEWPATISPASDVTTTASMTTTTAAPPDREMSLTLSENGYAYTRLSREQQENYDEIVKKLYDQRGYETYVEDLPGLAIALPHPLISEEEVEQLFSAVYDDHPEFFYLKNQYGWVRVGAFYPTVHLYYVWTVNDRADRAAELEAAVQSLTAACEGMGEYETELYFHDALIARCDYNEAAASDASLSEQSRQYYEASTPYAALCSGDPICGGYTRGMQLLLDRVGIDNMSLSNENHAWVMVWLDGEAYHLDVTWDDPVDGEEGHSHFNITDAEVRATRDYPAQAVAVPAATAIQYNYYTANGWYFESAFDDTLDDCIRGQIASGRDIVELKFAPDAYEDAVSHLFDDDGYYDAVYELADDALRDRWYNTILYVEDPELCTLKIYPEE